MEEFVLSPPRAILYVLGGVFLVSFASVALKKGNLRKKLIGFVVTAVILVAVGVFVYQPATIVVGEEGVDVRTLGGVDLSWEEVESAVYEPNLPTSRFRPTVRRIGIAVGDYRSGRFLLSNGDPARVYTEQSASAVILRTDELTYVFGPSNAEELAEAVNSYRVYEAEESSD